MEGEVMGCLLKWIGGVILLVLVALGLAWFMAPQIAGYTIRSTLGTDAQVRELHLGLQDTSFGGITIMSPKGSRISKALTVESGSAQAPLIPALYADPYVVESIHLKGLDLFLDFPEGPSLQTGNWGKMLAHSAAQSSPNDREILIKEVVLEDIRVTMIDQSGREQKLKPIDRIRFTNVSSRDGVEGSQLTAVVLNQVLRNILSIENLLPAVGRIVEDAGGVVGGAAGAATEAGGGLLRGIGGMFGAPDSPPAKP
jgi:hypothetical protein